MIKPIFLYGSSLLREKSEVIDESYINLLVLINDMFDTLINSKGVGLSAIQIGIPLRIFVTHYKEQTRVFINPKVLSTSNELVKSNEGCLSIPGINSQVIRNESITLEFYTEKFERHEEIFGNFEAIIIQHEMDHLNGILFTDKIAADRKYTILSQLVKIKNRKVKTEYLQF